MKGEEGIPVKYRCNDIFMIRTPALPIEKYLELFKYDNLEDNILEFISDNDNYNFINESLLVSSKSLQRSLNSNIKKRKKETL